MNKFKNYSDQELYEGGVFFPKLLYSTDFKNRVDEKALEEIKKDSASFFAKPIKAQASKLVNSYFDLSNYGDLDRLKPLDWATQLIDRKEILDKIDEELSPYHATMLQYKIFSLLNQPIASSKRFLFYSPIQSIRDLTLGELYSLSDTYIQDGTFDAISQITANVESVPDYMLSIEEEDLVSTPLTDTTHPAVTIDLSMHDDQLKKEFDSFLQKKRDSLKLSPGIKKLKEGLTGSLVKHRVLQYLDLKIMLKYIKNEKIFTHPNYAEYLFPDNPSGPSKFSKSTLTNAIIAISDDYIQSLLASINTKHNQRLERN